MGKKCERKAKASSSSLSGFSPSMPVPLCQLPLCAETSVVTTAPSSSVCAVTFSAAAPAISAAPFVPPMDVTPVEPSRKWSRVDSLQERAKMLATFEELWASDQSLSPSSGPSSAPPLPLVTPPTAVPAPILSAVLVAVWVASVTACSARSFLSLTWVSASSCAVPLVLAPTARASFAHRLSGTWSGISAIYSVLSRGMCLPVECPVFRPVHGPTGVHQSFRSGFGVGTPRQLVLQLCKDLRIMVNWEKSNLQLSTRVQYLGMLIDTSGSFSGCGDFFSPASVTPSTHVAASVGPHGFTGAFSSLRSLPDESFAVVPQGSLVPHGG